MSAAKPNARALRSARNRRYNDRRKAGLVGSDQTPQQAPHAPFRNLDAALAYSRISTDAKPSPEAVYAIPKPPPGTLPAGGMAMDDASSNVPTFSNWAPTAYPAGIGSTGSFFLGYPYLSELATLPEYRKISETVATEMTRRWIKIQAKDTDEDKTEIIQAIERAFDEFRIRDRFRDVCEQDGFFGKGHIYVDLGTDDPNELKSSIGNGRNGASKSKIAKGSIKGFRTIEPLWVYPRGYNSSNPLSPDWYRPQSWLVQGKEVHASRLLTFIGREVPDILKPSYMFGGLSMSQIAKPYVDNWLRTRQNVSDSVQKFSIMCLKTNLAEALQVQGAGDQLFKRLMLFNNTRNNAGTFAIDKDMEDFFNVSQPLGTLDHLQAQAQEQMASIASIPLVKLLGITPSGLNASSDGEVRCFYDHIHAYQERLFGIPLDTILSLVQLHLFGEIDPSITYAFEPLWTLDEKEAAEVRATEANTDIALTEAGILQPIESRQRIANDPDTPYAGLVVDDIPELPTPEDALGGAPEGRERPDAGEATDPGHRGPSRPDGAQDAEFNEADHPRGEGGKFSGNVHVVSTHDADSGKTKVHGVYADKAHAFEAHRVEMQRAYKAFHEDNYAGQSSRVPHRTAETRLAQHNYPAPRLETVRARGAGDERPDAISLVHEGATDENGNPEARIHAAAVSNLEAKSSAEEMARGFWDAGNQSFPSELSSQSVYGLRRAWNSEHPDHKTNRDFDFEDEDAVPTDLREKHREAWMAEANKPEAFPGLRKANAFQADQSRDGRSGVFNVTRHPVL